MKRFFIFILLIVLLPFPGNTARIISMFEIARWYLDADLVLICSAQETDTMLICHYDSLKTDGFRLAYDQIREKYHISIDSVLKRSSDVKGLPQTVMTPVFTVNLQEYRIDKKRFTGWDEHGDSVFLNQVEYRGNVGDEDTWFRIGKEKRVVILRHTGQDLVIDYAQVCDEHVLRLFSDVEHYGEAFFNPLH